jgi:hypothetical protein
VKPLTTEQALNAWFWLAIAFAIVALLSILPRHRQDPSKTVVYQSYIYDGGINSYELNRAEDDGGLFTYETVQTQVGMMRLMDGGFECFVNEPDGGSWTDTSQLCRAMYLTMTGRTSVDR